MLLHDKKRNAMLRPDDPEARIELAEALLVEGDAEAAAKQLERALVLAPDHPRARRALARAHLREGRPVPAERALDEHIRRFPDDPEARDELADLLLLSRRVDDAILHLEEALRVDPDNLKRRVRAAQLSSARRLVHRAKRHLDHARRLPNDDPEITQRLHEMALDLGDPAALAMPVELERERLRGRTLEAFEAPPLRGAARIGAVKAALEGLRRDDMSSVKRALVTAPPAEQRTDVYAFLRGDLALLEGDRDRAEKAFRQVIALTPGFALAHRRLGELSAARGRYADAAGSFERALALLPEDAQAAESLGDALLRMDKREEALRLYERALEKRPEGMLAAKAAALRSSRRSAEAEGPLIGSIAALGWSAFGGCVSPIEAAAMPGKGELVFTGNVGKTGQEAAKVAFSCLKARAPLLGIADAISRSDLHLHFVDTELQKEGPSAGLALALAGLSALTGRPLRPRLGATGEITLQGGIKPVGGLHEKMVAAYLGGVDVVLAPRRNLLDMKDVPPEAIRRVSLVYIDSFAEAIEHAFVEEGTKR